MKCAKVKLSVFYPPPRNIEIACDVHESDMKLEKKWTQAIYLGIS